MNIVPPVFPFLSHLSTVVTRKAYFSLIISHSQFSYLHVLTVLLNIVLLPCLVNTVNFSGATRPFSSLQGPISTPLLLEIFNKRPFVKP